MELSEQVFVSNSDSSTNNILASGSVDSFVYEFLTSAHIHTCNSSGPDSDAAAVAVSPRAHTQLIPPSKPKRTTTGNREAVKKYREKKKAHATYLEEEVKKLRFANQQLIRKVQRQSVLETEISRLRRLLLDLMHRIDAELGVFPFQKGSNSSTTWKGRDREFLRSSGSVMMMEMPCQDKELLCCHHPCTCKSSVESKCIPAIFACPINSDAAVKAGAETCGIKSAVSSASQVQ